MKKKIAGFFTHLAKAPLPVLCYSVVIAGWFLLSAAALGVDSTLRATGRLEEIHLQPEDFTAYGIQQQPNGVWQVYETLDSEGNVVVDPQMILDLEGKTLRSFRFGAEYSGYSYEINLYYTTRPNAEFDKNKRLWPTQQPDGSYLFTLPRTPIHRLRLDPASALVDITFTEIVLNERVHPLSYFNPGWAGLLMLASLPALLAAILRWAMDMAAHYSIKQKIQAWLGRAKKPG